MFCVLFEVRPRPTQWDAYLGTAKMLRPELEHIDGFVDNIRYRSLTRNGWILLTPGDIIAMMSWRTNQAAEALERRLVLKDGVRLRRVRVVRDYGMFDRREATQYYPEIMQTSDTP